MIIGRGFPRRTVNDIFINTPPVAVDDTFNTAFETAITITDAEILVNDTDADANTLTVQSVGNAVNGTLVDNGNGTYTLTPTAGFEGVATFDYVVSDGIETDTGTVSITVEAETTPTEWNIVAGDNVANITQAPPAPLAPAVAAGDGSANLA